MLPIPRRLALGLFLVLLAAPAVAQPQVGGPAVPSAPQGAVPSGTPLVTTEQSIAQQYAKLIQDAKNEKAALEDKIEELEKKIEALKHQASRIQLVAQKTEQVLPKILSVLGRSSGGRKPRSGAVIGAELAKVGIEASPDELRWLAAAIGNGGPGADGRVAAQASTRIERVNEAIHANGRAIAELREQIAAVDQQIAKLEKQRDETLSDLKKQQGTQKRRAR
jgi:septal ring factor EnvC (AmiA/AmiB activator)